MQMKDCEAYQSRLKGMSLGRENKRRGKGGGTERRGRRRTGQIGKRGEGTQAGGVGWRLVLIIFLFIYFFIIVNCLMLLTG